MVVDCYRNLNENNSNNKNIQFSSDSAILLNVLAAQKTNIALLNAPVSIV